MVEACKIQVSTFLFDCPSKVLDFSIYEDC